MKKELIISTPLVSVDWLQKNLKTNNLVVLDGSMKKVTNSDETISKAKIPNSIFFDIKNVFSNLDDPFPNAVPSEEQFTKEVQKLGINMDSAIVVYDDQGIYSSARVWWLFKAFGHNNIAVLDGGLPEWIKAKYNTDTAQETVSIHGNFEAKYNSKYFKFFKDIQGTITNDNDMILDARSSDRFNGSVKEPRKGLRSGNIPNSRSLPYSKLMDGKKLKEKDELNAIFNTFDYKGKNLIFSCGSGITACILALGAEITGLKNLSVYDGSWTEYGSLTNNTMGSSNKWSKNELVAYILLYASQSDMVVSNKERNVIISKVDMKTFDKIRKEFHQDNDYQSIQKIIAGLKDHNYTKMDIDLLLADIKMLFFADGSFDVTERTMYKLLNKLLHN